MLAASPIGAEFRVNSIWGTGQAFADIAMDSDGDFVVAWQSYQQDEDFYGIYAQRYSSSGVARGSEFQVNTTWLGTQVKPSIAVDADGDFVVAWQSSGQDGSGFGIYAQRYNSAGVAQGGEFRVNTFTTAFQFNSSVAMDADGDFVVVWQSFGQDESFNGTYAQRYNAEGVAQGSEFRVNTYTNSSQAEPSVAMDADGDFIVAWQSYGQDGSNYGIYARRYSATGVAQTSEFRVNTFTTGRQESPSVAADADGDFVVTWQSDAQDGSGFGVYAKRYNAAATAQGSEFRVNTLTANMQSQPSVSMDANGDFVVAWNSDNQDGSLYGIYAQQYNAAGVKQGAEFRVNTFTAGQQISPSVAMDADGDFVITWQSDPLDGSRYSVYAQRYNESTTTAGPWVSELRDGHRQIAPGGRLSTTLNKLTVAFTENLNVVGGATGANSVLNRANWRLSRDGVDVSSLIQQITFQLNSQTLKYEAQLTISALLSPGTCRLMALESIRGLTGNALDGDRNGTPGGHYVHTFAIASVQSAGTEFRVNTVTAGSQHIPSVAMDTDGDFVVAWMSPDGFSDGIYAQRFNSVGVKQDGEFRVNNTTLEMQGNPSVAMDGNGDFVVTWESYAYGSRFDVYARRYNAAGVAQGDEFRVNTSELGNQYSASVAMDADGDFVITWSSGDSSSSLYDIYARRYNAVGVALGDEFRINTNSSQGQSRPSVAMDSDGDFVVSWDYEFDDILVTRFGIYGQRFNSAGVKQGSEMRIILSTNMQIEPSVAMDEDGDFVVTWESYGQDGAAMGIYAQRFNAAGMDQGSEFRVNTFTANIQMSPAVAMDADGDFVVTWTSELQDGSSYGIYSQRYNAAGVRQGNEFRVNTTTTNDQRRPAVAMDADGNFVVAWSSDRQDGDRNGVYAQRYQAVAPVALSTSTLLLTGSDLADVMSVDRIAPADAPPYLNAHRNGVNYRIDPAKVTGIRMTGLAGDDRLNVGRTVTVPARLNGDSGNDILTGGAGIDSLLGGADNDTYLFDTDWALGTDTITDSSGIDTLNFSATTTRAVNVNLSSIVTQVVNAGLQLRLSSATAIENAVGGALNDILIGNSLANHLIGNAGNDVLSGQVGNDILNGGEGKNVLIGGTGADQLISGASEDLLLGARYLHENQMAALTAILKEWTSARSYSGRVGHLLGTLAGGLQGTYKLTSTTVKEDAALDKLTGGNGRDWYFRNSLGLPTTLRDLVTDANTDSVFTEIDTWL